MPQVRRSPPKAAICLTLLVAMVGILQTQGAAYNPNDTVVGAIRCDMWVGDLSGLGLAVERSLCPGSTALDPDGYHDRVPFFGQELGPDEVLARQLSSEIPQETRQAIVDQEIQFAKDAGLDYWAFYFVGFGLNDPYWQLPEGEPLALYLASAHKDDVKYCLIVSRHIIYADYPQWVDLFVARFKDSNYQKVLNGRPLLYLGHYEEEYRNISPEQIADLRSRCIAGGAGDPYIVLMGWSPQTTAEEAVRLGADATSAYVSPYGSLTGEPYSSLANHEADLWNSYASEASSRGKQHIPCVTTGWDPRPRDDNPSEYWPFVYGNWTAPGTPAEIANHFQEAIDFVGGHMGDATAANAILAYSWNEFDEGGSCLCPVLLQYGGSAILDACAEVWRTGPEVVPIEGKLLVSGWDENYNELAYYLEGSSDNAVHLPDLPDAHHLNLSPLEDQVAFTHVIADWFDNGVFQTQREMGKANLDGTDRVDLTGPGGPADIGGSNCYPKWSPDGSQIAFHHVDPIPGLLPCDAGFEVWVVNSDGTEAHRVSPEGAPAGLLAWMPDGYRIICWVSGLGICLIDTDGTDLEVMPVSGVDAVSADGSQVAWSATESTSRDGQPGVWRGLYVSSIDGSNVRLLVENFILESDIHAHLSRFGLDNAFEAFLLTGNAGPAYPTWSPNGDRIAFTADGIGATAPTFDPNGPFYWYQSELWVYDLTTSDLARISENQWCEVLPDWSGANTSPSHPEVTVSNTTVSFSEVTGEGLTTIIRNDDPPALPGGYQFCGDYYNVTTTAPYSGPITICMTYKHEQVPGGNEAALALLHYNEVTRKWDDITTSRDTENNIVCGQVDSLSTVGLAVMPIFGGFLPPINPDGSSVWNAGRTIPVKFQLWDAFDNPIGNAACQLATWHVSSQIIGTVPESAEASYADLDGMFRYDQDAGQYIYNLSTKGMPTGTWMLRVTAEDWPGFEATVLIGLR